MKLSFVTTPVRNLLTATTSTTAILIATLFITPLAQAHSAMENQALSSDLTQRISRFHCQGETLGACRAQLSAEFSEIEQRLIFKQVANQIAEVPRNNQTTIRQILEQASNDTRMIDIEHDLAFPLDSSASLNGAASGISIDLVALMPLVME